MLFLCHSLNLAKTVVFFGRSFGTGIVSCCLSVAVIAWIKTLGNSEGQKMGGHFFDLGVDPKIWEKTHYFHHPFWVFIITIHFGFSNPFVHRVWFSIIFTIHFGFSLSPSILGFQIHLFIGFGFPLFSPSILGFHYHHPFWVFKSICS